MTPKVKKKRIIRVKHPQLLRFRTAMRELLKAAKSSEEKKLWEMSSSLDIEDYSLWMKEKKKIANQIRELDRAEFRAPISCRLCDRKDLDLVFNPCSSEWYCEGCYTFNQEYYKNNPHPYEPDWRKIYP